MSCPGEEPLSVHCLMGLQKKHLYHLSGTFPENNARHRFQHRKFPWKKVVAAVRLAQQWQKYHLKETPQNALVDLGG